MERFATPTPFPLPVPLAGILHRANPQARGRAEVSPARVPRGFVVLAEARREPDGWSGVGRLGPAAPVTAFGRLRLGADDGVCRIASPGRGLALFARREGWQCRLRFPGGGCRRGVLGRHSGAPERLVLWSRAWSRSGRCGRNGL